MAKVKIPKRVGSVKIPKKVRRKANKAIEMAESPALRELAKAAIGAAASTRRVSQGARIEVNGEPLSAAATVRIDAERFGEAFRNAAIDGFRRFLEGFEEGLKEATVPETPQRAAPESKPAKPRAAKPKPAPSAKAKAAAKPKAAKAKPGARARGTATRPASGARA